MTVLIRMCDKDRERYGGPEWLPFDAAALDDMDADQLMPLERAMYPVTWFQVKNVELPRQSALGHKASAWLALHQNGVDVEWATFNPKTAKITSRAGGTPVPLDQRSPHPGAASDTSTSSENEASKRGSRSRRRHSRERSQG